MAGLSHRMIKPIRDLAIIALLIFGTRSVVADWNYVPSGSMKPTLLVGDLIFVNRLAYDLKVPFTTWHLAKWGNPARGDVVVFDSPADGRLLVKRVIGLPGDTVAMINNALFINGKPLHYALLGDQTGRELSVREQHAFSFADESLPGHAHPIMVSHAPYSHRNFGPVKVPEGKYLMLGDNRDRSADSRYFGFVDRKAILGRVIGTVLSLNPDHRYLPRVDRFFAGLG